MKLESIDFKLDKTRWKCDKTSYYHEGISKWARKLYPNLQKILGHLEIFVEGFRKRKKRRVFPIG